MRCPKCFLQHVDVLGWCNRNDCFSDQFYNKEHKMTREEAEKIVKSYNIGNNTYFNIKAIIDDGGENEWQIFDDEPFHRYGITRDNLKALDQAGYKIVKKDGT